MSVSAVATPKAGEDLAQVQDLLRDPLPLRLSAPDGAAIDLPDSLAALLRDAAAVLGRGQSVAVTALDDVLTTQEAADFLGFSRPTIVRLLDEGRIPSSRPGSHRRVRLSDLIDFQATMSADRAEFFRQLRSGAVNDPTWGANLVETR